MAEGIGFIEELSDEDLAKDLRNEFEGLGDRLVSLGASVGGLVSLAKATSAAETKARKYLKEQVEAENRLTLPKHFRRARNLIGETLSERAFERAWSQEAPEDWRRPGRRKVIPD